MFISFARPVGKLVSTLKDAISYACFKVFDERAGDTLESESKHDVWRKFGYGDHQETFLAENPGWVNGTGEAFRAAVLRSRYDHDALPA
jgi:hypothetical protein